jgi:fructokinase
MLTSAVMRIGIDLGGTKIEGIALDERGAERARIRVSTPKDYEAILAALAGVVGHLDETTGARGTVGVGIPGTISPATGLVKNANTVCLIGHPLDLDLGARIERPVRLANDANCFALSEATDGAGAPDGREVPGRVDGPFLPGDARPGAAPRVVFGVIIGTGTGGGLVVDGKVLVGPNCIAGEWGHNPLPWPRDDERPGPPCYCGKHGCIETFLSGPGIARDHHAHTGETLDAPAIAARAEAGDAGASATLTRYEDRLARALASVMNVLDPDIIVLGGGVSNIARLYTNLPAVWGRYVFSDTVATRVVPARHGDSSGVRGAAWLWPAAGG